jgi:hypothetical protein
VPELEDRARAAFASVMDPPEDAGARIRDAALRSLEPTPARRAARWGRRILRPVPAIAAAVLVAAVAVVLFLAAPSDPPTAPADVTGVEMVVRADPAAQTERLADVLRRRGELLGVTGMTVTVADGVVHVFVPRTHDVTWPVANLLTALGTAVYDPAASVVAADPSLRTVLDALPAPAAGEPVHWYAVRPEERPGASRIAGPFATEPAARRVDPLGGAPLRPVAVARDITLAITDDPIGSGRAGFAFAALRDPLVGPEEIAAVTGGGDELRVVVAEGARDRVGAALGGGPRTLVVTIGGDLPQTLTVLRLDRWDPSTGTLVFRVRRRADIPDRSSELARMLAPGGVDADVEVVSTTPVGPPPARSGEVAAPASVPAMLRNVARPGTVRRMVTAERGGRTLTVWTFVNPEGRELVWTDGALGGCPVAPDHPAVRACVGGRGPSGWSVAGRVGAGVASVVVEYAGGATEEAAVANGWFALLGTRDDPVRLVARDAPGTVVGTYEDVAIFAGP